LDGTSVDVELAATNIIYEGRPAMQVVCRDITERKSAHKELVMFRKAVETSGEAIFLTNVDGLITFVNHEFTAVYGYQPEEIVGKATPRILKSGAMDGEAYAHFWTTILGKQVVKGELTNRTKDGRLLVIEGSANPILDDNGQILGFLAVQRDVTERKKAEDLLRESEENLRWLVEHLEAPMGILDLDERFTFANSAMAGLFGLGATDLTGRNLGEFLDPQSLEFVKEQTKLRHSGVRNRYDLAVRRADGHRMQMMITATPQFDNHGQLRSVVATAKDISAKTR
jgi:PAS domain S-box-containing protein